MKAAEEATAKRDKGAEDNKIVQDQTNASPYTDLQGLTKKEPRGLLRKSFEDCVMFHLLTVFPSSAAEQERYYRIDRGIRDTGK